MSRAGTSSLELTGRAVILGIVLSFAMAAANMYLGLKGGMTIAADIPCSVISLILFQTLMRARSLAEVNVAQVTGATGEAIAAGLVFVFPALVLTGALPPFARWGAAELGMVTGAVLAGSILGVVLTVFLRRPMIVDSKELRFPEGIATAEILKTGMAALGEGKREGMGGVALAFLGGAAVKTFSTGVAVLEETVSTAFRAGGAAFKVGSDLSAALFGVGFIIEFNGACLVGMGSALACLVFVPVLTYLHPSAASVADAANQVWQNQVRFIGVGGMIVGGLWSIIKIRRELYDGMRAGMKGLGGSVHAEGKAADRPADVDLPQWLIWSLIVGCCVLAAAVYFSSVGFVGAALATVYTVLAVFFFVAISVYVVGLLGSSNQPVSGIVICTFLLAALVIFAGRVGGAEAVKTVLLTAGVVCLAACLSGTAAQAFKTTSLVGGTPRAAQIGLLSSSALVSLAVAPMMVFLDRAFVIGSERLPAPQAGMFAALAKGLFTEGSTIPWNMVGGGAALGIGLILLGSLLKRAGSSFSISPMAVAVGIYLPFTTTFPILLGGLVHLAVTMSRWDEARLAKAIRNGTVLCAGLVAGEALTAVVLAVPIGLGAVLPVPLLGPPQLRAGLAVLVLAALPLLLYRAIRRQSAR